jgi:hypothetical protein
MSKSNSSSLRDQDPRKIPIHIPHILQLTNPPNILIRSRNHDTPALFVDAVVLVSFAMAFVVGDVVDEDFVVVPT